MSGILDRQTHPDLETWRNLLRRSLTAIDEVQRQIHGAGENDRAPWEEDKPAPRVPAIRLGGGTVLSALWGHRYSRDVDLFTHDVQLITYLTPRLNDDIMGILGTTDYIETGNSLKFVYGGDKGSIDIVAAADILADAKPTIEEWEGFAVEIDDPAEIIAKKIFHRGDRATVRDYVDLVEAARQIPNLIPRLSKPLSSTIQRAIAVARDTSNARILEGLEKIRFIKPMPAPDALRAEAVKVMEQIAAGGGGGGRAAFLAWQNGMGR